MISMEPMAEIRRLYYAEHWKVGTIASELGLHHTTVNRAVGLLERSCSSQPRRTKTQPYEEFLRQTLEKHPRPSSYSALRHDPRAWLYGRHCSTSAARPPPETSLHRSLRPRASVLRRARAGGLGSLRTCAHRKGDAATELLRAQRFPIPGRCTSSSSSTNPLRTLLRVMFARCTNWEDVRESCCTTISRRP